jgi:RNA polymerase sigma-70 factor (ECF subfamily)
LGAVKHFLADQREHACRKKRGGGELPHSLDAPAGEDSGASLGSELADPSAFVADSVFDRQWALAVMERALTALGSEFKAEDRFNQFETLKPWLVGEAERLSQADAAARLGLSESALKVAVHRLRKRFRDTVRHEIAHTVGDARAVDEELRYLVEVLASG